MTDPRTECRCGGALEIRRKRGISGSTRPVYWCRSCQKSRTVPARDLREMPPEALAHLGLAVPKHNPQPGARKRAYQAALRSPRWQELRERVAERAGGMCERKGWGCTGKGTELGHLTYERLGYERDEDVEWCCRTCNQEERRERIARHVLGGDS